MPRARRRTSRRCERHEAVASAASTLPSRWGALLLLLLVWVLYGGKCGCVCIWRTDTSTRVVNGQCKGVTTPPRRRRDGRRRRPRRTRRTRRRPVDDDDDDDDDDRDRAPRGARPTRVVVREVVVVRPVERAVVARARGRDVAARTTTTRARARAHVFAE